MSKRKIVLVQPPFYRLFDDACSYNESQLSLGYLAGAIKTRTDWQVAIYNADFNRHPSFFGHTGSFRFKATHGISSFLESVSDLTLPIWREVRDTLQALKPDAVGITAMTQNFRSACMVAKVVKAIDPAIPVIVGGPHCSMVGGEVLDCPDIDYGVIGEGERTIVELLETLEKGGSWSGVKGIVYRSGGEKLATPARELIQELDQLPYPHLVAQHALIDYPLYPRGVFSSVLSSRGCPYRCTFCGSGRICGGRVRLRSPANVIEELRSLRLLGVRMVRFADDTFGWNRDWTEQLCTGIMKYCRGLKWKCEVHVNLIDNELVSLMKKAGCHMIELGVESGDDRILKEMQKRTTVEQALEACRVVRRHGIELQTYFIVGFPQETEESLRHTREAIRKIDGYIWLSVFSPFPGTEVYDYCKERGLLAADFDPTLQNFQTPMSYCSEIPQQRFRELVLETMQEVDAKNGENHLRRTFSINTLWRLREMGMRNSLKKGFEIFLSRNVLARAFRLFLG